jgi:plasmid maintenance system killer protein
MEVEFDRKFYKGKADDFYGYSLGAWGKQLAKGIEKRLQQARAVDNLGVLIPYKLPGRWHWLHEDREGQFSADVSGQMRLIFEPDGGHQQYQSENGSINDALIKKVIVIDIADTHD